MAHDRHPGRVLVADDNAGLLGLAKRCLETAGFEVIDASDGEEALRLYEEHRSTIALLLTDVVMPKLNGLELADRVLGMDPEQPILFMSGDKGCDYRGLECVPKPFRPATLIETVNRMLYVKAQSQKTAPAASRCVEP